MKQVDAKRLVIVDECGSNIALTPLYGWAPKGERAHGSVPRNRGKNTTLLASLSLTGVGACMVLEGSVNTLCNGYLDHPFINMPFETEKDPLPLLANSGGSLYNQTSLTASSCLNNAIFT